jgi:hypothetical protein
VSGGATFTQQSPSTPANVSSFSNILSASLQVGSPSTSSALNVLSNMKGSSSCGMMKLDTSSSSLPSSFDRLTHAARRGFTSYDTFQEMKYENKIIV